MKLLLSFMIGCSSALGMESGEIKSHQLIASSSLPSSRPDMARFSQDAWCAQEQDGNQFIQVKQVMKSYYVVHFILPWTKRKGGIGVSHSQP